MGVPGPVDLSVASTASDLRAGAATLALLGGFHLTRGNRSMRAQPAAQKVLAFLALSKAAVSRHHLAVTLWPRASEERAAASLRSALWRINQIHGHLIGIDPGFLRLHPEVEVDVHRMETRARRLLTGDGGPDVLPADLTGELLPDWYEDWVLLERERLRQLAMHALEALAAERSAAGRHAEAAEAALGAVQYEPLRESGHRVLIEAHVVAGNVSEALRHYDLYRSLLRREVGLEPSPRLAALVRSLQP